MKIFSYLYKADGSNVSRTQKTLALSFASMVNTVLHLILSMIAVRLMPKEEIAINSQTLLAYQVAAPVLLLGLANGIYYYLSRNEDRKRAVLCESLTIVTITCAGYALFLLLGGNKILSHQFQNSALTDTLYWMIPYALAMTYSTIVSCIFVFEGRLRFNAVYSIIQNILTMLVVLTVVFLMRSGVAMVISYTLCACIIAILSTVMVFRFVLPSAQYPTTPMQWRSMKALLAVSVPLGVSSMIGTLSTNLDKLIISSMLTPTIYAVYTQGARELPLVGTITGSINTVTIVDLTKAIKKGDYQSAISLFHKTAERSSMLLMPIMVFCWVAAKPLITVLYTESYLDAAGVFRIYLLYMPIRVVVYGPFLIALGKSKFVLWKTLVGLFVNAVLSYFCVLMLGAEGAALASIVSVYFVNVPLNLFVISRETGICWKHLLPFRDIVRLILYSLPGAGCCIGIQFLLFKWSAAITLLLQSICFVLITAFVVIWRYHLSWREVYKKTIKMLRFTTT